MMMWIDLHEYDGETEDGTLITLNMDMFAMMRVKGKPNGVVITDLYGGPASNVLVHETPEEILKLLGQ